MNDRSRALVAIFRGGYSGESVISHQSAATMMGALDPECYQGVFVTIDRDRWSAQDVDGNELQLDRGRLSIELNGAPVLAQMALIAIHGSPGEDGRLQGFLDLLDIPYQTGGVLNMAITFSKFSTCGLLREMGFRVARSIFLSSLKEGSVGAIVERIGVPCFVKPDQSGSSLGISKVKTMEELPGALEQAFRESPGVIVEEAITGRELTCGVYKLDGVVHALPICEVRTSREFFDYEAKYHAQDTEEIVPAPIPAAVASLIQERSKAIYEALGCKGMVRVDHFWDGQEIITIEVNTTPGFSKASIFPKMLHAAGTPIGTVVNGLVSEALNAPLQRSDGQ
ncbi:MAG: D-alanine--D-alanine ligase [Flavobacteriales bacterium]|nr:D-alanine--D-alanine ligase [Flavobacteriales bacterium]